MSTIKSARCLVTLVVKPGLRLQRFKPDGGKLPALSTLRVLRAHRWFPTAVRKFFIGLGTVGLHMGCKEKRPSQNQHEPCGRNQDASLNDLQDKLHLSFSNSQDEAVAGEHRISTGVSRSSCGAEARRIRTVNHRSKSHSIACDDNLPTTWGHV